MKKNVLLTVSLIVLLFLTSCDGTPDTRTTDFYKGSEGIRMTLTPNAPPPRIYYYSDAPNPDMNAFDVEIELHNRGASWSRGGIYVSGYDPSLIHLEGINIPKESAGIFENCRINFGASSLNDIFGGFSCNIPGIGVFDIGGRSGQIIDRLGFNIDALGINAGGGWTDTGGASFNIDFSNLGLDVLIYGRAFLASISGLTFDRYNGKEFLLAPNNYEYPGGETAIINFPGTIKNTWPAGLDGTDMTFLFTTCYAYTTYATPLVCIDPDPFSETTKVCRPGVIELKSTQGAPVAVTRIEQESTPYTSVFTIYIRNVGNGKIIYPGHLELCSPYNPGKLSMSSLDVVLVGDIRLSGSGQLLDCTPNDRLIRLRDGVGRITCKYQHEYLTTSSAYSTPLAIELWYGYSETARRNVYIKKVR